MKRTKNLFFMMLVAGSFAMLFSSCKKNEGVKEVVINLPEFVEEGEGKAFIDFSAGNKFKWNNNDEVVIYNLAVDGTTSEKAIYSAVGNVSGQAASRFEYASGDQITAKQYGYFMFYPVSKVEDPWNNNANMPNYQYFNVSPTQEYTIDVNGNPTLDPTSMALAVEVPDLSSSVQLKSIFGVLRLKLKGTGKVTKIEVEDARFNLNGRVAMKLHEVKMDRFTTAQNYFIGADDPYQDASFVTYWNQYREDLGYYTEAPAQGGKLMTLNCPSVALNNSTYTHFFIGLRPGALKYGYTLRVYFEGDATPLEYVNGGVSDWHYGIKAGIVKSVAIDLES